MTATQRMHNKYVMWIVLFVKARAATKSSMVAKEGWHLSSWCCWWWHWLRWQVGESHWQHNKYVVWIVLLVKPERLQNARRWPRKVHQCRRWRHWLRWLVAEARWSDVVSCSSCLTIISNSCTATMETSSQPHHSEPTHCSSRCDLCCNKSSLIDTHPFNRPLSGTTPVSRYEKSQTNLDFTEARDSEWQWHQLGHMQVCTSLQTDNHASTPPLSFLQAFLPPNEQHQSTHGKNSSLILI